MTERVCMLWHGRDRDTESKKDIKERERAWIEKVRFVLTAEIPWGGAVGVESFSHISNNHSSVLLPLITSSLPPPSPTRCSSSLFGKLKRLTPPRAGDTGRRRCVHLHAKERCAGIRIFSHSQIRFFLCEKCATVDKSRNSRGTP